MKDNVIKRGALLAVALLVLSGCATAPATCTDEEYAYYEKQGWDAYECDGDKQLDAE